MRHKVLNWTEVLNWTLPCHWRGIIKGTCFGPLLCNFVFSLKLTYIISKVQYSCFQEKEETH